MRRLTVEGLGIDESFEARQVQLYETLAGGFAPTLGELGVRVPAVAAAALTVMAAQVAYWKHYQSQDDASITARSRARACASLCLHGAASMRASQPQGGANARRQR